MSFSACSLSTAQSGPLIRDLIRANKTLKALKADLVALKFVPMKLYSLRLAVYSDASYANLPDGGSQGACIIFLYDSDKTCVPIAWASKRIKRIARSTLCAETLAAVDALDTAYLLSRLIAEILSCGDKPVDIDMYTDSKSMYDAIHTSNMMLDKRLRVDIAALREMNDNNEVFFHWVESKDQLADVLTKDGASKWKLLDVLTKCKF
jgi:ribonuclease HI